MNKAYSRINWENYPSTDTPLNETNLNHMDLAVDTIDDRVITLDTTKADEADLLTCVASISFNSTTGIMTITLKNGTQGTIDTGLSKLAINFDYDDDPTSPHYQQIILEMKDGTYKYIDLSALITQYEFTNSSTIAWTIGNDGTVSASVVDGSITAAKLQPNYLADIIVEVGKAQTAATNANADSLEAEGWAVGEQNGVPVSSGSPYYENNAKFYAQQSGGTALSALTDVQLSTPTNGQALVYDANSGKWVNGEGGMNIIQIPVPTVQTYTYNGSIQTFQFDSVDTQHITISGDSQSQAGTYVVTATLKSANDVWGDLTNAPKTFTWTIAKAQGSFSLSANSASVDVNNPTATINVTNVEGDGVISVASDDDNVATASISNGVITITGVGTGTATITVTMADSTNYLGTSATISVTASGFSTTISFALSGAAYDIVTITGDLHGSGNEVTSVLDNNGNANVTMEIIPNTNYLFTSSAPSLDGTGNYSTEVTLQENTSTVNISKLPSGYAEVPYIQSSGSQYIDTGYVVKSTDIEGSLDFQWLSFSDQYSHQYQMFCGSYDRGTDTKGFNLESFYQNQFYVFTVFGTANDVAVPKDGNKARAEYAIEGNDANLKVSVLGTIYTQTEAVTALSSRNMFLFALNDSNTSAIVPRLPISARVFGCRFKNSNGYTCNLIPCKRKSDGVAGMYDIINNSFKANSGSGTFSIGTSW